MVLSLIILLLTVTQASEPPLLEKYSKEVHKTVKKAYGLKEFNISVDQHNQQLSKLETDNMHIGYVYVSEVAACHLGGCAPSYDTTTELVENEIKLGSEYFDVLILLTPEKMIKKIKILNYFSDYGYEVTSKNYLKKFQGQHVCAFATGDDGIDAISGATISSMALEGTLGQLCD